MKELLYPHNDWWQTNHPLSFGPNRLSTDVTSRVLRLSDASKLSAKVREGNAKLFQSKAYQNALDARSWQEILRPVFCATEINLVSSSTRLLSNERDFILPHEFILNPLLGTKNITFIKSDYQSLLNRNLMRFPETSELDADHIWLAPVVSENDINAIKMLIEQKKISEKIATDILMIDFAKPVFSAKRCELLAYVPTDFSPNWLKDFINELTTSSRMSLTILPFLADGDSFIHYHKPALDTYASQLSGSNALLELFHVLVESREEAFINEIAKNPLGQILEPGFRVIFPERQISPF